MVQWIIEHHEGSEFTDRKNDRGGATRHGVTWRLFNAYMGREMPIEALKDLKKDLATDILHSEFCFKPKLSAIHDDRLRLCAIDFAVHSGPVTAVRGLQIAAGMTSPHDGILGPVTQDAINRVDAGDMHRRLLAYRLRFLADIVSRDKTQAAHVGWWNRIANLIEIPEGGL